MVGGATWLAAGVPCVVGTCPALAEATDGAAIVVNPHDRAALGRTMVSLLTRRSQRAELVERGKRAARRLSWKKSTKALAQIYKSLTSFRVLAGGAA